MTQWMSTRIGFSSDQTGTQQNNFTKCFCVIYLNEYMYVHLLLIGSKMVTTSIVII